MKKILLALLIAAVVVPTFAQVTVSGDAKFASVFMPGEVANDVMTGEVMKYNSDLRVNVGFKDDYTEGLIRFRARGLSNTAFVLDQAWFNTNLAGFFKIEGIRLNLSGGFRDQNTGKIATINAWQVSRIEYIVSKGQNFRIDAGIPVATAYFSLDFSGNKYVLDSTKALLPMVAGAYGKIADLDYELAWAKPGTVDEVGNLMAQVKYGLKLNDTMSLTLAGGVDMDLDDALDTSNALGHSMNGDAGDMKYVAAVQFNMLGPVGIRVGVDFNGGTNKTGTEMLHLANALALNTLITHKVVDFEAGIVLDINQFDSTMTYGSGKDGNDAGVAMFFAGLRKIIGKNELKIGYAWGNPDYASGANGLADIRGDGKFRLTTDDVGVYANIQNLVGAPMGGIYLSAYVKF